MALKSILETLDDVPAELHDHYVEKDGKFILQVEGIREHPEVGALKKAYESEKGNAKKLREDLKAANDKIAVLPEDFDAEEYLKLIELRAELEADPEKRKKANDENFQSQKRIFEQRISALEKKHADEVAALKSKVETAEGRVKKLLVDEGLTKALIDAGVGKEFVKAAKAMLAPSVKVVQDEDGADPRAIVETDMGEAELPKFISDWAQSDEGKPFIPREPAQARMEVAVEPSPPARTRSIRRLRT
jgi:hypothetical protein